jgi:serine/threonine protein kinase
MKLFQQDEFNLISEISRGSYGKALKCRHNRSKKNIVIKRFYNDNLFMNFTTYNEMVFLKALNTNYPLSSLKFYGIVYIDKNISIVLEHVDILLNDYISTLIFAETKVFEQKVKLLLKNLLVAVSNLNSLGINHLDLREHNVMLTKNEQVKLIDFGISMFFGITSITEKKKFLMTDHINPKDVMKSNLSIDVFSIGSIIYNIYNSRYRQRINLNAEDYICPIFDHVKEFYSDVEHKIHDKKLKHLLSKMLVTNDKKFSRLYADECLSHPYFGSQTLKTHDLSYSHYHKEIFNSFIKKKFPTSYTYNNDDFEYFLIICSKILFIFQDLNTVVNAIPKIKYLFMEGKIKKDKLLGYAVMYTIITSYIFTHNLYNPIDSLEMCEWKYSIQDMKKIELDIITFDIDIFLDFVSVNDLIKTLYIKLSNKNLNYDDINSVIEYIKTKIKLFVIFNNSNNLTVWEIILSIYYDYIDNNCCKLFDFGDRNIQHVNLVKLIIPDKKLFPIEYIEPDESLNNCFFNPVQICGNLCYKIDDLNIINGLIIKE